MGKFSANLFFYFFILVLFLEAIFSFNLIIYRTFSLFQKCFIVCDDFFCALDHNIGSCAKTDSTNGRSHPKS